MDPVISGPLAALSIGASALGAGTSAFGALQSGNANSKMYQYQAGVAKMNENIARSDADYTRAVGETEAQASGMKTRFTLGKIIAQQSGSGLDVNSGSNRDVQESEQAIGSHDESVIRSNAAKRAYGYEVEAANTSAQGEIYKASASQSKTAGAISAASSILGGVSSVSGKWLQAKQVGIFT